MHFYEVNIQTLSNNSLEVRRSAEWRSRQTARESEANTHQSPRQAAVKRLWPSQGGGASLSYSSFMLCGCWCPTQLPTLLNVLGITGKSPLLQVKLCNVNRADRLMGISKKAVLAIITSWVPNIVMVLVGTWRRQQKNESNKHINILAADWPPRLLTYWTCILTKKADRSHICGIACKPLLPSNCISDFSIFRQRQRPCSRLETLKQEVFFIKRDFITKNVLKENQWAFVAGDLS